MSDHNNIYNIMSKLDALKPEPETPKQAAERIYESVEAKGSILEGVKGVEQNLSEKYQGFKKTVAAIKKSGTADNPEAVAAAIGRKKYGKAAFQKAAAAGKKMGESEQGVAESSNKWKVVLASDPKGESYEFDAHDEDHANGVAQDIADHENAPVILLFNNRKVEVVEPERWEGMAETVDMEEGSRTPQDWEVKSAVWGLDKQGVYQEPQNIKSHFVRADRSSRAEEKAKREYEPGRQTWSIHSRGNKEQGVAEGMNDTVYPNAQVIKSKNGKPVGEIYQDGNSWGCFHYRADRGYDGIDSREDAIAALKDLHQETGRSRPDYTIKGVAEERETLKTKGGTIYKGGTYGTHYDGDDAPKKKEKHVPKTGQKGRPKKEKPAEYSKTNDPFGRVPDTAPKGKKGTVIKGKGNQDTVDEGRNAVGQMVLESVNFKKMMDECDMTMAEMLECIDQDIKTYKTTGDMTDRLRDFMHLHQHAKKQMEENRPVPYEVPAVQRQAAGAAPLTPSDVQAQDAARSMHPGMTKLDAPKPAVTDELDELAKLAGITDEGNAFTGKLHNTPKGGEFELDGNTFKDTSNLDEAMCNECGMYESQCSCQEGNLFTKHLKDTPDGGEFEIGGKHYKDTSSLEEMARLAGIFQEGKDYGDTSFNEPPTYDNTPDEQIQDEDVLLRGGDGEVAGMEKAMHNDKPTFKNGDNPLSETTDLIKPAAEFDFVEAMGRKLMQAYEGIKAK